MEVPPPPGKEPPIGNSDHLFIKGSVGQTYDVVLTVSEQPAVVMALGGRINSMSFDSGTSRLSLQVKQLGLIDKPPGDPGDDVFALVVTEGKPNDSDAEGPPVAANGTFFSYNGTPKSLEIIPPPPGTPAFGLKLSGPKGTYGLFQMFLPATLLDFLGAEAGEDLEPEDFGVFIKENGRENQVSNTVSNVSGGLLVELGVEFDGSSTKVDESYDPDSFGQGSSAKPVTKFLTVRPQPSLSIAPKSFVVGNKVKLYGFLEQEDLVNKVKIQLLQDGKWVTIAKPKVQEDGSYEATITASKLGLGGAGGSAVGVLATSSARTRARATSSAVSSKLSLSR